MKENELYVSKPLNEDHSADDFTRDLFDNLLYTETYDMLPEDAQWQLGEIKKWCEYYDVSFAEMGDRELLLSKAPWHQCVWLDEATGELLRMIGLDDEELWDENGHLNVEALCQDEE